MIKETTNLRRIRGLNPKKKIWILQGSQGSAKTFSILLILIDFCLKQKAEIIIASAELSKMKITVIKDFKNIMKILGFWESVGRWHGSDFIYTFSKTDATVKFIGLDKEDIGKGLRSDVVFLNEANKVNFETYRQLTSRSKKIILDYNPDGYFWAHTEIIDVRDDFDFLQLDFTGNEELSDEERTEILTYYQLGYNTDGTIKNEYWANIWRVYGKGEVGSKEGRVYTNWKKISYVYGDN